MRWKTGAYVNLKWPAINHFRLPRIAEYVTNSPRFLQHVPFSPSQTHPAMRRSAISRYRQKAFAN
jgi:hypothetical protein